MANRLLAPGIEAIDALGPGIRAAMSTREPTLPANYSMRRTGPHAKDGIDNIVDFMTVLGADPGDLVLPHRWPHLDRVEVVGYDNVVTDKRVGLNPKVMPGDVPGMENSCDGLVTQEYGLTIGAQGADCPMLYLHDPQTHTIGIIHCGWKPVARGVVPNAIAQFRSLGAAPANIKAYVAPGAGDDVYEFVNGPVEKKLLTATGRLADFERMLRPNRQTNGATPALALNQLVVNDLRAQGVTSIVNDPRSCIEDTGLHSFRRDGDPADVSQSQHGLGIGVIWLEG